MKKTPPSKGAEERFAIRAESAIHRASVVLPAVKRLVKVYSGERVNYGHVGTMADIDDKVAELLVLLGYALAHDSNASESEVLAWMESGGFKS